MLRPLVILPDIPVGLVEKFLVGVQLVFEQSASECLLHFPFTLSGCLPAVEAHVLHDLREAHVLHEVRALLLLIRS